MIPRSAMEKDLKSQEKALTDEINSLGKKVSSSVLLWYFFNKLRFSGQIPGETIQRRAVAATRHRMSLCYPSGCIESDIFLVQQRTEAIVRSEGP